MLFNEDYLRVSRPITTDGVNLKLKDGKVQYKVIHLPKTARKFLETQNANTPDNLKVKIELVPFVPYEPKPVPTVNAELEAKDKEIAELKELLNKKTVADLQKKSAKNEKTESTVLS